MKEDYLWDKTGDDPEIKKLEELLAVFQYKETAAPASRTAKILAFPERPRRREYSFAFALAACVTVAIILGIWFTIPREDQTARNLAQTTPPQVKSETPNQTVITKIDNFPAAEIEKVAPPVKQRKLNTRPTLPSVRHARKIVRNVEKANPTVMLTSEEKYAYGQLMLALSITGSKLKIVQDKVNGVEEEKGSNER